jgi:hypothetical protein
MILLCGTFCFTQCSDDNFYTKEMYKRGGYLLSSTSQNVYTVVIPFKEASPVTYFSVGCGGSKPNAEDVVIELQPDDYLFDRYNRSNFDIDSSSYAILLPKERYDIPSMTVVLPANSSDPYVKVPVNIQQQGLSPDSIYFIPIAIKSVSRYEVNPEKYNALVRITVENDYAEQQPTTIYLQKGTSLTGSTVTALNGSKIVQPLSTNEIRFFAGNIAQTAKSTKADILKSAVTVRINTDESLTVLPFGTIEVETLSDPDYNKYYIRIDPETGKEIQMFDLYYRYRTLNSTNPNVYSAWITIRESLQRSN